jgi:putative DNA primase/helicase
MGLSKREALEMASQLSGTPLPTGKEGSWGVPHARRDFNSSVAKHSEKVQDWPRRRLQEILAQSLDGDHHTAVPLGLYREARGLTAAPCPKALRFHPRLPYYHSPEGREGVLIGGYPAMLALVTGADGELATIQRLYLTPLGQKLTLTYEGETLPARKQMTAVRPGATMGAAVRLFEATNVLAVAEGIETALAFHLLTGLPAWSCLSAQGMANVIIPDTVEEVVIAADRDVSGVGLQFSHKLARRLHTDRKRVSIAMPPDLNPGGNTDWNDVLLDGGNNDE